MAHRSDDVDLVRSVGSPLVDEDTEKYSFPVNSDGGGGGGGDGGDNCEDLSTADNGNDDADLPQCKIKRNYSCNLCPFFSQNPRSFLYHSRDVHFDPIKIFECSQCLYASKHSQKLQRHINMIHVAEKNRVKRTSSKAVKMEVKKELRPIKPKPSETSSEASALKNSKEDDTNTSILKNILKPEDQNPSDAEVADGEFKCSLCNFKNKNQKLMRRHEKIVHLKKRFLRCNKCSYVTHVKARYTKHVKYHSMPMIKCGLCDFRTPYKWNLDRHYKNHCGTGAFQCSKCNFRADIKQSLTVHEMNHHVPPVGQGAVMARKKNKVGASEIPFTEPDKVVDKEEFEHLKMDREDSDPGNFEEKDSKEEDNFKDPIFQNIRNVKVPYTNKRESANNNHFQTDFIHPDDIVPRYGQIYVKNLKCKFCSYKAVFSHEIWRHEKRIHGYIRPESRKENVPKRPPPKLIPIQNKSATVTPISSPILKIPAVKKKMGASSPEIFPGDKSVNESEFNEMCKNSCLTSSLKDFVSLIGDEEGLKTIPDSSRENLEEECLKEITQSHETDDSKGVDSAKQKQIDFLKKKNASFFDKLKEKLMTGNSEEQSLFCENCGFQSKCLSEAATHQKRCQSNSNFKGDSDSFSENDIVLSGAELSSTRCQHCRQRCKTSSDLYNHLKSCKAFCATLDSQSNMTMNDVDFEVKIKTEDPSCEEEEKLVNDGNSMENRVFVWNDLYQGQEEEEEGMDIDNRSNDDFLLDTPSMYGTVTSKGSDNTESGTMVLEVDSRLNLTVKKVFKCPHCSFWASTASRFHVHIVGHLNKKPFECSLCLYRSNWRWDITKHIRLKSARDPSHLEAQVNMTDETGRRNYSKYNKYLTMMKVQEPSAESSGTGRRSKPSEATQGNIGEGDIIPLPAPPRLTRAPTPGAPQKLLQGIPLRPPPPLKAAHHIPSQPKPLPLKQSSAKKTLWKCKKCNFRDSNKNSVLAHVKGHYSKKANNVMKSATSGSSAEFPTSTNSSSLNEKSGAHSFNFPAKLPTKTPSYKCGHCQQVSNWKHVIQRHCKLKHNGDALIQVGWKEEPIHRSGKSEGNHENFQPAENSIELISCDICPFTTDTEGDLTAHKLNHIDRPGSIFKCSYCPFYVPSKIAVLEHMEIHGVNEGCDLTSLKVDNFDPSECNEEFSVQNCGGSSESSKRYKCRQCPYLSNSRTQFLYHKQFHRPRDAPFKCMYCSYNVSRRHLLHQHLRVHHKQKGISVKEEQQFCQNSEPSPGLLCDVNTVHMTEIPLVWVLKSGNFHKMYKCRWCPHVNIRKINIQEHEKMHKASDENATGEGNQSSVKLRCSDCNYTCNNAGVLASHVKVHQGYYGEIRCLVDSTKSDIDQIRELQNSLRVIEPEVVIKEETNFEVELSPKIRIEVEDEPLSSQPENAYTGKQEESASATEEKKILNFCSKCPARFFFKKELRIHSKFHTISLPFRCAYCTYTARQRPHLLAHYKVHTQEYQEKTVGLVKTYSVAADAPQPKTIILIKDSQVIEGPVWAVVCLSDPSEEGKPKQEGSYSKPAPKHACHRCPAKFFKSVALQYHLTLHGGSHQHKCKYCDYAVKTYGNLIKHQLVHKEESKNKVKKSLKFSYEFPISGNDLYQYQTNTNPLAEEQKAENGFLKAETDQQFGTSIHGSPEFIYPTYLKNGKIKEKKYKCHKCPSAFEKRDQYRIHASLHGSKQKYSCDKCDYSVKYYANYVQHERKHQSYEAALKAKDSIKQLPMPLKNIDKVPLVMETSKNGATLCELSLSEQQSLLLRDRKKSVDGMDEKKLLDCHHCPYTSNRRDAFENHKKRHFQVSNVRFEFGCVHCDYSTPQKNFLREHTKLHFGKNPRYRAEAYLKVEKMELWCCDDKRRGESLMSDSNLLIFQDKGEEAEDRFFPPLEDDEDDKKEICKLEVFRSPERSENPTAESLPQNFSIFSNSEPDLVTYKKDTSMECPLSFQNEDLIEMIKESCAERAGKVHTVEKAKPKIKRWRGKNWKCKSCPHAFGKKDQYLRHVALHGSNQRHNCDICDYSVKFYTNYVQHMRMHQMHEPNRVILVKKNLQSLEEGSPQTGISNESETPINEEGIAGKTPGSRPDEESDSLSSGERKHASDKFEDTDQDHDYSSSTDATEGSSFSVEDGSSSLVSNKKTAETADEIKEETENVSMVVPVPASPPS